LILPTPWFKRHETLSANHRASISPIHQNTECRQITPCGSITVVDPSHTLVQTSWDLVSQSQGFNLSHTSKYRVSSNHTV